MKYITLITMFLAAVAGAFAQAATQNKPGSFTGHCPTRNHHNHQII